MSIEMWLTYDSNREKLRFPVLPESIEMSSGSNDDTTYVYGVGDVITAKKPAAKQIKFDSFFPAKRCQGSIANPVNPKKAVEFMNNVMNLEGCARFVMTGGANPIAMNCRIAFSVKELGGDVGTIYYTITIKEYKEVKARQIKVKNSFKVAQIKQETTGRASTQSTTRTYTVKSGDCLWNIAKKYYGNGAEYMKIYNANSGIFKGRSPNLIYPGDVLTIP